MAIEQAAHRPTIENHDWVAEQLAAASIVEWDRFVVDESDGMQVVEVYGWIERPDDSYKDFVVLTLHPERKALGYITSSERWDTYLHRTWFSDHPGVPMTNCQRVEAVFDIENMIELEGS